MNEEKGKTCCCSYEYNHCCIIFHSVWVWHSGGLILCDIRLVQSQPQNVRGRKKRFGSSSLPIRGVQWSDWPVGNSATPHPLVTLNISVFIAGISLRQEGSWWNGFTCTDELLNRIRINDRKSYWKEVVNPTLNPFYPITMLWFGYCTR